MNPVDELVGQCAQIAALREQIRALPAREANLGRLPPIMITTETGTGKRLVAHILHRSSSRSAAQFVEVNGGSPSTRGRVREGKDRSVRCSTLDRPKF